MKAATVSDEKPMTWGRRSTEEAQVRAWQDKHAEGKHKALPRQPSTMQV